MTNVRVQHEPPQVVISENTSFTHDVIYELFKSTPKSEYDSTLERALVLGCYALQLNEIGQMLDNAARDVQGELMRLKVLFELRGLRERGAAKGDILEADIADEIQKYADKMQWSDSITRTGNSIGSLPRRKVGDLVVNVDMEGASRSIVVEAKFDKAVPFGDPAKSDKASSDEKSAQGQNYVALANRESNFSIFVVAKDNCHASIRDQGLLTFLPEQPGFVAIVDRTTGDWSSLWAAYSLARALCLADRADSGDWSPIGLIVKKMSRALARLDAIDGALSTVSSSAETILEEVRSISVIRESVNEEVVRLSALIEEWSKNPAGARQRMDTYLEIS